MDSTVISPGPNHAVISTERGYPYHHGYGYGHGLDYFLLSELAANARSTAEGQGHIRHDIGEVKADTLREISSVGRDTLQGFHAQSREMADLGRDLGHQLAHNADIIRETGARLQHEICETRADVKDEGRRNCERISQVERALTEQITATRVEQLRQHGELRELILRENCETRERVQQEGAATREQASEHRMRDLEARNARLAARLDRFNTAGLA